MKKNKGFTLVELLAVIVVLALIMIIAIPTVLSVMENARRQSFYLYANNVYQKALDKYVNDMSTASRGRLDCSVYKIPNDLDISNSGDYSGWVKVERVAADSGNYSYTANISNDNGLYSVRYCTQQGTDCNPEIDSGSETYKSGTWDVGEDKEGNANKTTKIEITAPEGYKMCYEYQYPNAQGRLVKVQPVCVSGGPVRGDTYEYKVSLTMKDKQRAVDNILMKDAEVDEGFKDTFYQAIDSYAESHRGEMDRLPVTELTCDGSGGVVSDPGSSIYDQTSIGTTTTTTTEVEYSVATTTEPMSTSIQTTQVAPVDDSALLKSLSISGYEINFTPAQLSYTLTVPYSATSLQINYLAAEGATVTMTGHENIGIGNNTITISVYNGTASAAYHIYVFRLGDPNAKVDPVVEATRQYQVDEGLPDPTLAASNAKLANIVISRYQLSDVFSPDTFKYDVEIDEGVEELTLSPILQSKTAKYTIQGNDHLQDNSQITIIVRSENGYYTNQYVLTIHVKKKTKTSTIVLRCVAVGLGAVLIALLTIMQKQKQAGKLIDNLTEEKQQQAENNYVQPTQVDNNNNNDQGNV